MGWVTAGSLTASDVLASDGRTVQEWLDELNVEIFDLVGTEDGETLTTESGDTLELE